MAPTGKKRPQKQPTSGPVSEARFPLGRPLTICGVLVAFAVTFATLQVHSYTQRSAAWDEPIHLTTGYVALTRQDYRVDPSHPPFARMWAALPLLAMRQVTLNDVEGTIDRESIPDWLYRGKAYDFARRFMYVENDADRLLYAARFMVVVLGVMLGILLFCWTHEWLGFLPALFALAFYTISPNLTTHASLVTTDFGVTCFTFGAVYCLWRTCRRLTVLNVAGLTTCFALAIVTKFSGLVLGPVVVLLLTVAVLQRSAITFRAACGLVGLLGVGAFVAVWAVYGFRYAPSASGAWLLQLHNTPMMQQRVPGLASIVGWIDAYHLLPNLFTQGFLFSQASAQMLPAFLAGNYSSEGWWYYFPVAFLIKTPISEIVLLVAGLVVYVKYRRQLGPANEAFVVLPILVFLGVAMASRINIGVRHILPIYPFVLLIAVAATKELIAARGKVGRIALAAVTVYWGVRFASVYPDTPTFFNEFVGGPRKGFRYLADSNLGWGQYLKPLKQWMDRHGVSHVNLAYFGQADPAYYRMNVTHLPGAPSFALESIARPRLPGYVAISGTVLSGVYLPPQWRLFYRPFRDREPIAVLGSMRVYWVERWPEPPQDARYPARLSPPEIEAHADLADALLFGQQWYNRAILHYGEYLKYRPDQVGTQVKFSVALMAAGRTDEAIQTLRRTVELAPAEAEARRLLAKALFDTGNVAEAAIHAQEAARLKPHDPTSRELLDDALARQRQGG